ncbi:hypothetical protein Back11_55260 [Paenibacillus baekrokdamisoli]|uniref:Uncharacterized protein n=1 Tax=Paenibacillus baekrokdamisoli TaxID=1712516 RepID=A0A3G9JE55_9BACL|nr:aminoglycoside phosphotransferase family protein [Paenibacillus baekrokdamisoli]MBB3071837.1 aminoglycoside phosphotransferase (APT) family kinase protein [Paenibacillus baekrokdamisoli]BBH24181.1 hypothetical protein Back11_55260 [Paenibacillus baekrokdamisoli]
MNSKSRIYKTINIREIEQIVKSAFDTDTTIDSWRELSGGLFNTTYFIKTLRPTKSLVLRIAPIRQELLFDFEKVMMGIEPGLYKLFNDHNIPAPKVILYDETHRILPRNYIITEYINSITLNDPSFPGEHKSKIQYDLGVYTAKLHSIKSDKFGWPTPNNEVNGSHLWLDVVKKFVEEDAEKTSNHHVFSEKEIKEFNEFFRKNDHLFVNRERPSLVHNDLWDPNILVHKVNQDWEIAAIIDADRAMYADREFEFVLWGNDPHFMKGYGIGLDMSNEGILRRKAYSLITGFFGAYVYKVQYDNETAYIDTKNWVLDVLKDVMNNS